MRINHLLGNECKYLPGIDASGVADDPSVSAPEPAVLVDASLLLCLEVEWRDVLLVRLPDLCTSFTDPALTAVSN